MLRYAISDRKLFAGDEAAQQRQVVQQAVLLALEGVDFFQVREKDLPPEALLDLTCAIRDEVRATGKPMRVVLNGPFRIAEQAGVAWHRAGNSEEMQPACSASCHTLEEIQQLRGQASLFLFAPVFGKRVGQGRALPGTGLQALQDAVAEAGSTPVLALGGVTEANAQQCLTAGAAGIAGIHIFLRPRP